MKQPTRDGKGQSAGGGHRRDLAEEETRVLGSHDSAGAATHVAPPMMAPAPAMTPGAMTPPAMMSPQPAPMREQMAPEGGHTRILGYDSSVRTDPVVGWLVILDGPGKGNFRPIFRGSNTIGRSPSQRVPIDFGDDAISGEKQAFLTYDERVRSYQLVPNLERPNLVYHNDKALTSNVDLHQHDKVMMGRTTLLFVPLCGPDFDWGSLK
jgi:hypothetical protein